MLIDYLKMRILGLKTIRSINYVVPNIDHEMNKSFKILFIDDNQLEIIDTLKKEYGYDISYKDNIRHIYDAAIYDIILCDLHGVDSSSTLDGANTLRRLREMYPNKRLILYTAGTLSNEQIEVINKYADKRIKKGQDIDTWNSIITNCIKEIIDPRETWKRMKEYLEHKDVDTKDIAIFEDIFVRSYIKKSTKNIDRMISAFAKYNMYEDYIKVIKPIVQSAIKYAISTKP